MTALTIHDFSFEIPGQPPSINRMYETAYQFDGQGNRYAGRMKARFVEQYQMIAMNACQRAKPSLWTPREPYRPKEGRGLIVVELDFLLDRDVDCDNTMKAILDAIKFGLGTKVVQSKRTRQPRVAPIYDDNRFLGRAMSKIIGSKHPRVEVSIRG